jgi:NAD(P)-dependent dehydrogenase (short-subunit alcohol dehydrogenase family)
MNVRIAIFGQAKQDGGMQDLTNRTVLVTGGSKGIGAAIVRALGAGAVASIVHHDIGAGAEEASSAIPEHRKLLVGADLSDLAACERLWSEAVGWRGAVDVLVNNAAIMMWEGGVHRDLEDWDRVWEQSLRVNVLAPGRIMRQAVRHYLDRGGGIIVTISSWAAQRGVTNPDTIAYGATKAAVRAMTQSIARAYARDGILAYTLAPGVVRTRLSEQFAATQGGEEAISSQLASGRWVEPDELAEVVSFLCSGKVPQMSGATLDVNGASYIR